MSRSIAIFAQLWQQYCRETPGVKAIYDLFVQRNETVINDHIALRTFDDPRVDIEVLAKPFIQHGYYEAGRYVFKEKKLFAKHYEHSDPQQPKVFISQLLTKCFSPFLQNTVNDILTKIPHSLLDNAEKLFCHPALWQPLSYAIYQQLLTESEYAAWLYAFNFRANHFTVSVNHLKSFGSLQEVNEFLKTAGYKLNDFGGEIKGNPQELLEQSSIMALPVNVQFVEGIYAIPLAYYEFARRYPMKNGQVYQGFIANSADKIFQSTDVNQS